MTRKPYPSDVTEDEWAFIAPYLSLMREDAPQRDYVLTVQIKIHDQNIARGANLWSGEEVTFASNLAEIALPAYGYAIYSLSVNSSEKSD